MSTTHTTEPGTKLPTGSLTPGPVRTRRVMADRAPPLHGMVAGYIGHQTVAIGLPTGLVAALADRPGATVEKLANRFDLESPAHLGGVFAERRPTATPHHPR